MIDYLPHTAYQARCIGVNLSNLHGNVAAWVLLLSVIFSYLEMEAEGPLAPGVRLVQLVNPRAKIHIPVCWIARPFLLLTH